MALKSFLCTAQITNTGGLEITEKGFCYSSTNDYPTKDNSNVWIVPGNVPASSNNYVFFDTITGLTEATKYWVNSYAINSLGIDYSDTAQSATSSGIAVLPTITVNILNSGLPQVLYEMGTSSFLVVTGLTTPGGETIFNNGYLNQTSSPQPSNPIKTWTGWQQTYTTSSPPISVNFLPRALEPQSWTLKQDVYYNCGSPYYIISATTTIESVFPFLWVMKSYYQGHPYFNNSSFYTEASAAQVGIYLYNGKMIIKKPDVMVPLEFLVTPNDASHKYLIFGYPEYYGDVQFSIDGTNFYNPGGTNSNLSVTNMATNNTLATPYTYSFKILQYTFSTLSDKPIPFYIRFTS